jgi:hypothetical protein
MANFIKIIAISTLTILCGTQAQAQTWQKVTVGGGSDSYTAWGTTSCASGYSAAYTGEAITSFLGDSGAAAGNTICSDTSLSHDSFGDGGDSNSGWFDGSGTYSGFSGVGTYMVQHRKISCAVCVK